MLVPPKIGYSLIDGYEFICPYAGVGHHRGAYSLDFPQAKIFSLPQVDEWHIHWMSSFLRGQKHKHLHQATKLWVVDLSTWLSDMF